jgi:hypothetical protein
MKNILKAFAPFIIILIVGVLGIGAKAYFLNNVSPKDNTLAPTTAPQDDDTIKAVDRVTDAPPPTNPPEEDPNFAFAQCIHKSGATFYGAFWCPHCQAQKRLFGAAQDELPYVECSTPDGNGQTEICKDKGIKSYPTWTFKDGSRQTGEMSFATLSEKTNCPLPK